MCLPAFWTPLSRSMTDKTPATSTVNTGHGRPSAPRLAIFGIFIAFIAVFLLLILFLPKHEGELSPNERRILAKSPDTSFSSIMDGSFSKQFETWLQDHFPLRTGFVSLYSYINRYTGRNAVENVILGDGNRLFSAPIEYNEANIETNIDKLSRFIDKNSLNAYTYLIPTSASMLESELPKLHLEYHDDAIINRFSEALSAKAECIPVRELFGNYSDPSALYYRTDHHITMQGSYLSYVEIAKRLGLTPLPESEFEKASYDFYGTAYGQSGLFALPCDTLETWVGPYDEDLSVVTVDGSEETLHQGSLDKDCLKEDVVDKYAAYLYSNHGITRIENPTVPDGKLLVLKDSFGNAIVPFLAAHYNTIIMIDTRSLYYSPSMPTPSELCEQYGIDDFVVITGLDTVAEGTLDWLR